MRTVYLIGPDKAIKAMLSYPMTSGRNFDEVLRLLDSIQLTAKHKVATPVNWKQGEDVIIVPAVSDEEAKLKFTKGWKAPVPYAGGVAAQGLRRPPGERSSPGFREATHPAQAAGVTIEAGRTLVYYGSAQSPRRRRRPAVSARARAPVIRASRSACSSQISRCAGVDFAIERACARRDSFQETGQSVSLRLVARLISKCL